MTALLRKKTGLNLQILEFSSAAAVVDIGIHIECYERASLQIHFK